MDALELSLGEYMRGVYLELWGPQDVVEGNKYADVISESTSAKRCGFDIKLMWKTESIDDSDGTYCTLVKVFNNISLRSSIKTSLILLLDSMPTDIPGYNDIQNCELEDKILTAFMQSAYAYVLSRDLNNDLNITH